MEESPNRGRFQFNLKEVLVIVAGTALALGSFKSDDPWVVIPMLAISGFAFVCLCIWHEGSRLARAGVALLLVVLLTFIGWRDLRKPVSLAVATTLPPQALPLGKSQSNRQIRNLLYGNRKFLRRNHPQLRLPLRNLNNRS
jgi:hypothetical protein